MHWNVTGAVAVLEEFNHLVVDALLATEKLK
jgi:hypothetical protein